MAGKFIVALCLVFIPLTGHADNRNVIRQSDGSITFVVDEGLEPIEEKYRYLSDGEKMAKAILSKDKTILNGAYNIVASSFEGAKNLRGAEKDAFFQCVLRAYKKHQSVTLSPDMIWLLISQGFARYVDAHSDELRPKLVSHAGKMDLAIETKQDLLSGQADYEKLVGDFASQIEKYTKDDIAQTLTADFSTTLPAERIASQITLMESVKSYFEYMVYYAACGIPTITLKGTPADWQRVLDKTRKLAGYGLAEWTRSLEPILEQFVLASKGQPNQKFWQGIVKKGPTDRLRGGGCSNEKPTMLDGWLLKLFPDENGQTPDSIHHQKEMPSQRVYVGLKYRMIDPERGTVMSETPMELMAGFIGEEVDTLANMLTPKIGWLLRKAEKNEDLLSDLQKKSEKSIDLKVKEVPEMLAQLPHIKGLGLHFTDGIVLPEWFDHIKFDYISIDGKVSSSDNLLKILAKINHIEYLYIYFNQEPDISYLRITSNKQTPETQPEAPDNAQHIKHLDLHYADKAVLPEWLSLFGIDHLTLEGKMTKAEKRNLSKSLKKANVRKFELERAEKH